MYCHYGPGAREATVPARRCSRAPGLSSLRPRIRQGQDARLGWLTPSGNLALLGRAVPTRPGHGQPDYPEAMCGRFVQLPVIDFGQPGLADLAPGLAEIQPSYNLAPTQRASVILDRGEGRQVTRLAWGLLPFWAKAKGLQGSTINARIETVATKPAFRSAFKKRRCVVPMAGYYEWSVSPEDGKKDPWFIHATGPLLAAGLWEDTSPLLPDGNLGTFTIITGDSSGVSADIHDRMPVWLQAGQIDEWMAVSTDDAMAMLLASEPPAMEAYRVSRAVNTPRNNVEDLLQQVA
ncbi:SOS response-associated peptidase [Nonomuraea sp. NPDC003804]